MSTSRALCNVPNPKANAYNSLFHFMIRRLGCLEPSYVVCIRGLIVVAARVAKRGGISDEQVFHCLVSAPGYIVVRLIGVVGEREVCGPGDTDRGHEGLRQVLANKEPDPCNQFHTESLTSWN